jgi:hypothetical protein
MTQVDKPFSLIRRRRRSIVSRAPASSGISLLSRPRGANLNIDREIQHAIPNHLTADPSISADDG